MARQRSTYSHNSLAAMVVIAGGLLLCTQHGLASNPVALKTVRDLVGTGTAKAQLIEKRVKEDRVDFELILTDADGKTIGGYAPPYLPNAADVPALWRDFISTQLSMPAEDDQITVREERRADNQSYAVAFVLDHSPSMTMPRAVRMQRAVQSALRHFDQNDYVSVVKFTARVTVEVPPTSDKEEYMSSFKVNGLNMKSDGTAIFDATKRALDEMEELPASAKRVLIVFTDGEDNSSSTQLDAVVEAAKKQQATVFAVTYGVTNDNPLTYLASQTGGRVHRLADVYDFDRIFLGIYRGLRHSYIVSVDNKRNVNDEEIFGAVTSLSASRSTGVRTSEVLALVPKSGVEIAPIISNDDLLVLNVDVNFLGSGDVHPADMPLIDSVATLLIQRNDLTLELLARNDPAANVDPTADMRRLDAIREQLIRRGVSPTRVVRVGGGFDSRFGSQAPQTEKRTTFVLSKM